MQAVEIAVSDSKLALATSGVHTLAQAVQAAAESGNIVEMQSHLAAAATRAALNDAHPHLCFNALACLADCGTALAAAGIGMRSHVRTLFRKARIALYPPALGVLYSFGALCPVVPAEDLQGIGG